MRWIWAIAGLALVGSVRAETLLEQGYRQMYNLQFDSAHRTFAKYEQEKPSDPLGPVSDAAAYLFSEFDRLKILQSQFFVDNQKFLRLKRPAPDAAVRQKFESDLARAQGLSERESNNPPAAANALFANTLRLGLHADYLALIERQDLAALREIRSARQNATALLASHPECYDAYLAPGVENYLLSLKAAPVRWLLQAGGAQTSKQVGLQNLRVTAQKGHLLLPYARLLLAVAALRDHDREQGKQLLSWLAREYPNNTLYRQELRKLQ
jgi:hypothetical protein